MSRPVLLAFVAILIPSAYAVEPTLDGTNVQRLPHEARLPLLASQVTIIQGTRQPGGGCLYAYQTQLASGETRARQDLAFDPDTCRALVEEGIPDALALQAFAPPAPAVPSSSSNASLAASCAGPKAEHRANLLVQWVDPYDSTAGTAYELLPLSPSPALTTTVDLAWSPTESCALSCPGSTSHSGGGSPGAGWSQDFQSTSQIRQGSSSCYSGVGVSFSTRYRNGTDQSPVYNCAPRDITIPQTAAIIGRSGLVGRANFSDTSYVSGAYEGCGRDMFKRVLSQVDGSPLALPVPETPGLP